MMENIDLEPNNDSNYDSICAEFTFAHQLYESNNEYHSRILLDSGSSYSVFCDKTLLLDI